MGVVIPFPTDLRRECFLVTWQGFYSTAQVSRLASVPISTLRAWKRRQIIGPSIQVVVDGKVVDEGYSYADLAIVKLLRALRVRQLNLRSVARTLRHLFDRFGPLSSLQWQQAHVFVLGKDVYAQKPDAWDTTVATKFGQKAEMRVLGELTEEEGGILIPTRFDPYVEIKLNVMEGEPVIRGTRVPTSLVFVMYNQGVKIPELTRLYTPIKRVAIEKAIEFEKSLDEALAAATA